jgi:hypothetical protein
MVVTYTDIPHDGDRTTLWTPQVGDVVLALFGVNATGGAPLSNGSLYVAQPRGEDLHLWAECDFTSFTGLADANFFAHTGTLPRIVEDAVPVVFGYDAQGDGDLTAGHVELHAIVLRHP